MVDSGAYQGQGLLKKCEPDFMQIALQNSRAIRDMHTFNLVIDCDVH